MKTPDWAKTFQTFTSDFVEACRERKRQENALNLLISVITPLRF